MVETKKTTETRAKKPSFLRKDWHKKIKLGSTVKKNRKWRSPRGRQNKIRLNRKGHSARPKIGWGSSEKSELTRIENIHQLEKIKGEKEVLLARIGKKKRKEITAKASELKIKIINKPRGSN